MANPKTGSKKQTSDKSEDTPEIPEKGSADTLPPEAPEAPEEAKAPKAPKAVKTPPAKSEGESDAAKQKKAVAAAAKAPRAVPSKQVQGMTSGTALVTKSKYVATQWWHLKRGETFTAPKTVFASLKKAGFLK